jgi:2-dehydro-3-deoxyphosphogluconate aldolase/(4S)-4-hydroxy-2-oxoglutarate aldolase
VIPKREIVGKIIDCGLVVIVRTGSPDQATRIAEACVEGDVTALEVTFTVPAAAAVIENLAKRFGDRILVGAGTVLDPETTRVALLSGAQFVVSPCLNPATARMCNRYQIPYLPGAGTVREIVEAMECGAEIIKVFPGETLGPAFVKATLAPIPQALLMPTGGVHVDNVAHWVRAGAVAVGVGGNLTSGAKTGDYGSITALARMFIERIHEARAQ